MTDVVADADRLSPLMGARSIALVGASERNLIVRIALENLRRWGYGGRVIGIHPSGQPVDGLEVLPSYDEPVDLALLAVGARRLPDALRAAAEAGVRGAIIPGAGANEGGRAVEDELRRIAAEAGLTVIGPNCMGLASLHDAVVPYVGTLDPDLQPGAVGLVSHSGSVCELFTSMPWRVGLSGVLSVGNEVSVDMSAAIEFLVRDERTRTIGLFVEGVRRPDAFREALAAAAEAGKRVVALKVGSSDVARAGTVSHTGALAGDGRVFSAVLRDAGAIEVRDVDELELTLELLGKGLRRDPGRVIYVGDSGGQANLFADLAEEAGAELPGLAEETRRALADRFPSLDPVQNPVDLWALGDPEADYRDGLRLVVRAEPHLVVFGVDKHLARGEPERAFVRAGVEAVDEPGAVVLMSYGGDSADPAILRACWERRIPVARGAERTLRALARLARAGGRPHDGERPSIDAGAVRRLARDTEAWSEHAAKELLAAAGIPVTREREGGSADAAAAAATEIGFPVVAKVSGPGIAHKTEAGGVRLGLRSEDDVRAAAAELLMLGPRVLVAEERRGEVELIVGAFDDPQFGPCGLVGLGGAWTEALGSALAIAGPGSVAAVRRALEDAAWGHLLLEGARGRRFPVDRVVEAVLRLIAVVDACRDAIATVEVNPLMIDGDDVVAVDALVVPRGEGR
ncbi:MAG TPA: acetate--CoA ligase family protein [Actinomycetota bacterium]|nr:acetate--CoA ligase family protein [Actinomycetota bacterium]